MYLYAGTQKKHTDATVFPYQLGVESISSLMWKKLANKKRIGLVTNQTGRDQSGRRTIDIFSDHGVALACVLVPEHGLDGKVLAGSDVLDGVDMQTGLSIISLYKHGSGKQVDPKILQKIDMFIVDLQDVGMRHYTYISTLYRVLESAAEHKKQVIVLDRPNLLGGLMEGPLVEDGLHSFVSIAPIPLRHGMTIGELALYFNKKILKKPARLHVVSMTGYQRNDATIQKLLAPLSPNIASRKAVNGYSFLGLLGEVKPFDIGIATPHAFQRIGLPQSLNIDKSFWKEMQGILADAEIASRRCAYTRQNGSRYDGLLLSLESVETISTLSLFFSLIMCAHKWDISLECSALFDKAVGTKSIREWIMQQTPFSCVRNSINKQLSDFYRRAQCCFLYDPHPQLRLIE